MPLSSRKRFLLVTVLLAGIFVGLGWFLHLFPEPIGSRSGLLASAARTTFWLTLSVGALGLPLGILAGVARHSRKPLARWPASFYIWLFRGTPALTQILFAYYALPALVPWLKLDEFWAAFLALGLNVGAYNAEAVRSGLTAIPAAQTEVGHCLGLSRFQIFRFVVFPQAFRVALPSLTNNLVSLLKDSSLASAIGLVELTLAGSRISSETFQPAPVLGIIAVIYLVLTSVLTLFLWGWRGEEVKS